MFPPTSFWFRGVPNKDRDAYFVWEEGKGPDVVFEYTSESTRDEDLDEKYNLYQDVLKVPEYFLFDPKAGVPDPVPPGISSPLRADTYPSSQSRAACPARCWASISSGRGPSCGCTTRPPARSC